jgi:hypothetical protein
MRNVVRFVREAGGWAVTSLIASLTSFVVSLYEHIKGKTFSAYGLVVLAAVLFCVGAYRAWLKKDRELEKLLKDLRRSKEELRHMLTEQLTYGARLRKKPINTVPALREWKEDIEDWVNATAMLLDSFELTSQSVVFKNADASGEAVEAEPPPIQSIDDLSEWVPYLDQKLRKHQAALEEILKEFWTIFPITPNRT